MPYHDNMDISKIARLVALPVMVVAGSTHAQIWQTPRQTLSQPLLSHYKLSGNIAQKGNARLEMDVAGGLVVGVFAEADSIDEAAIALGAAWGISAKELPQVVKTLKSSKLLERAASSKKGLTVGVNDAYTEILSLKKQNKRWQVYLSLKIQPDKAFPVVKSVTGSAKAENVIRVFSDFECPYCQRFAKAELAAWQKKPNNYRIYHYHFPLSFHQNATSAAEASQCALAQGKFWPYTDQLSNNFSEWTKAKPVKVAEIYRKYASKLGLNIATFKTCQASSSTKADVNAQFQAGRELGVGGTPTIFLNGIKLTSYKNTDQMKAIRKITLAKPSALAVIDKRLAQFK